MGWFGATWSLAGKDKAIGRTFAATLQVPKGTKGVVKLPFKGGRTTVNGRAVINVVGGTLTLEGGEYSLVVEG